MAAIDPDVRSELARRGGRERWAGADPEAALDARRAAAKATNSAPALARRIVRQWPGLTKAERVEVFHILAALRDPRPTNT